MEKTELQIAGICGSLRKKSFNRQLLNTAIHLGQQEGINIVPVEIGDLPLYNADLDLPQAENRPATVDHMRQQIAEADGLLIVSPEYNYSIPAPLKNALDWASRGNDSPLKRKPVAVVGASISSLGTVRMQVHLLSIFLYMDMMPVYQPEVLISNAAKKFDEQGQLTDDIARQLLRKKLAGLQQLILQQQSLKELPYK